MNQDQMRFELVVQLINRLGPDAPTIAKLVDELMDVVSPPTYAEKEGSVG